MPENGPYAAEIEALSRAALTPWPPKGEADRMTPIERWLKSGDVEAAISEGLSEAGIGHASIWQIEQIRKALLAVVPAEPQEAVDLLREVDDGWDRMMESDDLDGMVEVVAKVRAFLAAAGGQ